MATKVAGKLAGKAGRKGKPQAAFTPFLKVTIPANQAKPSPPLGPQLGQVRLQLVRHFFLGLFNLLRQ